QLALHSGNGGSATLGHEAHRFIVQWVFFAPFATALAATIETTAGFFDTGENVIDVVRRTAKFPGLDDAVHFVIGDERAVHANRQTGARRQVEHVAMPKQLLGATLVEDGARIDLARYLESHAGRNVGLDQAGN